MHPEEAKAHENNPWWLDHLQWLVENKPELAKKLFLLNKSGLRLYLSRKVRQAVNLFDNLLRKKNLLPEEAVELVMNQVISPPPSENPPEPLPESLRQRILRWGENPEDLKIATTQ